MEDFLEGRNVSRYTCLGGVQILHSGNLSWGRLGDIGGGGCYIETLFPLPIDTTMQLRLTIAGNILDLSAKVVWTIPQAGMGVSFAFVSAQEKDRIAQILEDVKTIGKSPTAHPIARMRRNKTVVRISRDTELLGKIARQLDEKGILTRQDLIDLVNASL